MNKWLFVWVHYFEELFNFLPSFRYTTSAPAIHLYRKCYRSYSTLSDICSEMGTEIHGKSKAIQYWTNITLLQCHSSAGKFWHFCICKHTKRIHHNGLKKAPTTNGSKTEIIFHFQVIYQLNVFSERKINYWCEELDFSDSFLGIRSAQVSYCYFLIKLLDLFDTVFFVLRKRTRQISFLHVYHHVAILVGAYIAVTWAPGNPRWNIKMDFYLHSNPCHFKYTFGFDVGGHPWIFGTLNCFVHIIMYGYYFGSVFHPVLKTNLMIKRSITQLQIVSEFFLKFI